VARAGGWHTLVVSKAFTSEETVDDPVIVRARSPLPEGVPNYVTARARWPP
jgi:hypothetical protein